ncbi:D-alanyl-D-alanine carboxypeptidase family protein [Heyndrickxia oleronia]|uniref:D-alanyl-D-alanine carboxypeptidase n=1 Tax=Heyndrickxia oleronia TaxID=38875 RepID=A0AAW6SLR8_9BACI|nr:D-alanyl-D-alanine carboxypeptidase family protein [Heyndrickxia oleronia]MDH5159686.1 D-alanyl-D-alanine carboxypeptidase [Heyndrickxia oleronia]
MKKIWLFAFVSVLSFNFLYKVHASDKPKLNLASESAVLVDSTTGKILYEKNAFKRLYPASLTKIATAIYAIENGNLNDMVTISKNVENTDGTRVYLVAGEKVTLKHLLQGLLINSGNDAGVAIAEYMNGSIPKFASQLNQYLVDKIGVSATNFVNPHGLFDENHYTTAYDLAKITNYAIKNDIFKQIFGTKELEWNGEGWQTTLFTHHLILKGEIEYKEVTGGKTGYVDQSGQTLATTAENDKIHLTVIIMNAKSKNDAYNDTKKLLDYGFNHFETSTLAKGVTFKVGEEIFEAPKDIEYTKPLNGTVSEDILDDGMLQISDRSGDTLDTLKLTPMKVKAAENKPEVTEKQTTSPSKNWGLYFVIFAFLLILTVIIKKINQNRM